ncbi:DMT family transporter (plasmid) [Paracoccus denitrificans]|jgi:drug/metabolite transporter (DMT)-like permease|uniref:DMT family transporter n=2 Tax=Paracoccus denitrificans TaxID=266 RepID=UPI000942A950|nr:DMT family transporter [Paracoccus denitrificans]QAR29304.1 DMT family transporter [Paracoccus denitrificans]UFS68112.1 DMT family transporter [Paracoccus denitrificans]UPV98367.1 DMT family transporter [Paracoccus denitrificans]WQO37056.1 DMT family transporter [Paracoccus denitrificans]GEK66668.1 transporter [Paracoccus denitrificans]
MGMKSAGWGSGLIGVIIFSGSLPATRVAVADFTPIFLTSARALLAALLGAIFLVALRQPRPGRGDILPLALVAIGVVVGFPLLTALALRHITAAHSIVFIGLLPLATAIFGVLRGGERPHAPFWAFSIIGAAAVAGFALRGGGGGTVAGDLLMVAAVVVCGLGYAEGATLSRRLGGWQVISWSLILSLPVMGVLTLVTWPDGFGDVTIPGWTGLAYVSVFSMMVGFIFWYRGLALGGIAGVGQLQLLQPFFGFVLAAIFLREPIAWTMIASTVIVVACVAGARRFA